MVLTNDVSDDDEMLCNLQCVGVIRRELGIETIDLGKPRHDLISKFYTDEGCINKIMAAIYLAHLHLQYYSLLEDYSLGDEDENNKQIEAYEVWCRKLSDKVAAIVEGGEVTHGWLQ